MNGSVAGRIAIRGTGLLVASLVVVGVGSGAVIHAEARRSLDQALLAAAFNDAHPEVGDGWDVEHARSPIETWHVGRREARIPADVVEAARDSEQPRFVDVDGDRVVLLSAEDEREHELLVAAAAPAVTVERSVGPFVLPYLALAGLVSALASVGLVSVVRGAFTPLDRARAEAEGVLTLAEGKRLTEDAPEEVRSLLQAMNRLLDRLDDAGRAQGRFTAEAAHELRTPVAAMLGELDVALRRERSAEEYRAVLVSARDEVERLRRMVAALTALARLDAGETERGRDLVRVSEVVAAVADGVRTEIVDDVELEVHRGLLEMAISNLVRNAKRHGAEPIVLRARREGELLVFEVDDHGPGVAEADREALFDRFKRSGEARRHDPEGLGLGLPIARQVARRLGGDCVLLAAPGGGLRARLTVYWNRGEHGA